jgi:Ca2+-binding RTX toxin-like protein
MGKNRLSARRVVAMVGSAAALLGSSLAWSSTPAQAAFPGINGVVACSSNRGGNVDLWTFNPTGTELQPTNISNTPTSTEGRPRYRSDGRKIVFESNRNGGSDLYIADADGSNVQRLTFTGDASSGAWHPDGSQIVYQRNIPGLFFEVYKVNIDGTGVTPLASHPSEDSLPFWSPDGTVIAFNSRRTDAAADIHLMDSFGGNISGPLGVMGVEDSWPNYSPDGSQLTFHSRRDDPAGEEIYRMPATGGAATRLTTNTGPVQGSFDIFPAWSPDGTRIVWNSGRAGGSDGFGEIYTMNASDGSGIIRVTNNAATDQRCDWQPLCTIYGAGDIQGTEGNDIICGSEGSDRIAGLGGNDVIYGFGGDDQISAGAGEDRSFGGLGSDLVTGGIGLDFSSAGPGNDRIVADFGERVDPGSGTDFCTIGRVGPTCPPRLS